MLNEKQDRLSAMDLVYLRQDNMYNGYDILERKDFPLYNKLIEKYDLEHFRKHFVEQKSLFKNYEQIINDIGRTIKGCNFEIVLHNVRNPLRSIVALSNTDEVSRRKKYDPSTIFVVEFLKYQGKKSLKAFELEGGIVGYAKEMKNKTVKATSIPLYHPRYGLIAILCINIDMIKIRSFSRNAKDKFFKNYTRIVSKKPVYEKDQITLNREIALASKS